MFGSRLFAAWHFASRYFRADRSAGQIVSDAIPFFRPRERIAATVDLVGVEIHLSAGTLGLAVGVASTLQGVSLNLETGRLGAEGIQNPSPEELATLLGLEAVSGE